MRQGPSHAHPVTPPDRMSFVPCEGNDTATKIQPDGCQWEHLSAKRAPAHMIGSCGRDRTENYKDWTASIANVSSPIRNGLDNGAPNSASSISNTSPA